MPSTGTAHAFLAGWGGAIFPSHYGWTLRGCPVVPFSPHVGSCVMRAGLRAPPSRVLYVRPLVFPLVCVLATPNDYTFAPSSDVWACASPSQLRSRCAFGYNQLDTRCSRVAVLGYLCDHWVGRLESPDLLADAPCSCGVSFGVKNSNKVTPKVYQLDR